MSSKTQGILHVLAGFVGVPISFVFLPAPYNVWAGAAWAALVAGVAFYNQSITTQGTQG